MEKEGGNRERMRKCRESISLHFLIFSPFPPHFLILSPFPLRFLFISSFSLHFLAARLQGCNDSCSPASRYKIFHPYPIMFICMLLYYDQAFKFDNILVREALLWKVGGLEVERTTLKFVMIQIKESSPSSQISQKMFPPFFMQSLRKLPLFKT